MTLLQSKRSQRIALWTIWILGTLKVLAAIFVDLVPTDYLTLAVRVVAALGVLGVMLAKLLPRDVRDKYQHLMFCRPMYTPPHLTVPDNLKVSFRKSKNQKK